MTVTATTTRNDSIATAGQTSFAYTFRVLATSDVTVYKNNVVVAPADYTVNNIGTVAGGTFVLDTGASLNDTVSIVLTMPVTRDTNYQENGAFLAQDVNGDFDKIYIGAIQNENAIDRTIRLSDAENVPVDMTLPLKDARKGKALKFNDTTGAPEAVDLSGFGAQYTAGSGLALSVGNEFSNTAPDQTVSLTGAGATNVTGTYPNFTITSTGGGDVTLAGNNTFTGNNTFNASLSAPGGITAGSFFSVGTTGIVDVTKIKAGSGSSGTPTYTFGADENTGMWRAGADLLAFSTAGAEALRIIANGNVGIGLSSPSSKLAVAGTIAGTSTDSYSHKFNSGTSSFITNEINGTGDSAAKLYWKKNDTDDLMTLDMSGTLDVTGTVLADGLTVDGDGIIQANMGAKLEIKSTDNFINANEIIGSVDFISADYNHTAQPVKVQLEARAFNNLGSGDLYISTTNAATKADRLRVSYNGDVSFYEDTGTTPKMVWDSSAESLGIGVTDPIYPLEVSGEAGIELYNSSGGGDVLNFRPSLGDANKYNMSISSYDHSGGGVGPADGISINAFDGVSIATGSSTARQERARIDSTGNLLVGTTSVQGAGGITLASAGYVYASRPSSTAIYADRTGSDGAITDFRKDGTTVGSIGVAQSGDRTYFSGGSYGIASDTSEAIIMPCGATGTGNDGVLSLGKSSARFKDLYLSGTANVASVNVNGLVEFDSLSGTGAVEITDILDEDNMASNSATALATQQSIKAYVDANSGGGGGGDITAVTAGDGLSGGGTTGAVTVDVDSTVVRTSGTQTISGQKNFNDVIRINNTNAILRVTAGASNPATIQFGDANDFDIGKIAYNNSDNSMAFTTSTGERARITSTGDFLLGKTTNSTSSVGCVLDDSGIMSATSDVASQQGISIRNNSSTDSLAGLRTFNGVAQITATSATGGGHSIAMDGGLSGEYARFTSAKRLGIGITAPTQALHVVGNIVATGNITANFSDERLKDFKGTIPNALDKVAQLNGYYYTPNETAQALGVDNNGVEVGVSAQEVEAVLPEIVTDSAVGKDYKTVMYEKLTPLLIEAVKELTQKVEKLELKLNEMEK